MSHDTERIHQSPAELPSTGTPPEDEMLDDESEYLEPVKRLSILDKLSRKQKIGFVAGVLAGATAFGFGGAKAVEAINPGASTGISPTIGAPLVPGSTEQPSATASSSESATVGPNSLIGNKNDITQFEWSEVTQMYMDVPSQSIFDALAACNQDEVNVIRKVLMGHESIGDMTRILNRHGVQTNDWIPDPTASTQG